MAKVEKTEATEATVTEKVQPLKMHHLRPAPGAKTAKIRVGRGEGGKRGKTAGRGTKGQKARYQVPARFEGGQMPLHMRLPKLRGFKNPFRVEYQVVNLDKLAELYPEGGSVTIDDLVAKGAVRKGQPVKVLGTGEIAVKLEIAVDAVSGSAKDKILAAGGSISED
ncbi:50S ribosomal protein L15 [Antribacter gilvus]|uniref:50S ribosomal protein L15 n=1 Tax=Antribacter gilvus TaxID=2304675 RepID=UPI000F77C20B|nr:50S ribosomal protein L15 [Antribacter gilvus]